MSVHLGIWSKTQQLLELATKLTIIGVPALYLMGWAYLETYWARFGISETLLGFSATDYLRAGSLVLIRLIADGSSWVVIIAWVCLPVLLGLMAVRFFAIPTLFQAGRRIHSGLHPLRRQARVSSRHRRLARSMEALIDAFTAGVLTFLIAFLLILGLIYAGIKPAKEQAGAYAEKELRALAQLASLERNWVLAHTEAASSRPALVLQCGSEMCAFLVGERVEVLPRSGIIKAETCRRIGRSDHGSFHCSP